MGRSEYTGKKSELQKTVDLDLINDKLGLEEIAKVITHTEDIIKQVNVQDVELIQKIKNMTAHITEKQYIDEQIYRRDREIMGILRKFSD